MKRQVNLGRFFTSFILLLGNPLYCNCYMRPLKRWARAGGVKLLGACAGPPHLSDELLQAVAFLDLRCRSRGDTQKDELEKDDENVQAPTAKPKLKVKCPADCDCDVSYSFWHGTLSLFGSFHCFRPVLACS